MRLHKDHLPALLTYLDAMQVDVKEINNKFSPKYKFKYLGGYCWGYDQGTHIEFHGQTIQELQQAFKEALDEPSDK